MAKLRPRGPDCWGATKMKAPTGWSMGGAMIFQHNIFCFAILNIFYASLKIFFLFSMWHHRQDQYLFHIRKIVVMASYLPESQWWCFWELYSDSADRHRVPLLRHSNNKSADKYFQTRIGCSLVGNLQVSVIFCPYLSYVVEHIISAIYLCCTICKCNKLLRQHGALLLSKFWAIYPLSHSTPSPRQVQVGFTTEIRKRA